jgi:uncharacterized membrane protein
MERDQYRILTMSLPKFGIILAIFGLVLMVAAIATIGALLPTKFYAGPQNQHSTLAETLGVAFLVVFRIGPGVAILGVVIAIIGWWQRRKQKGPA